MEKSFQVPAAVPARFIEDHWWPHSSMRVRAAALRVIRSSGAGGADFGGWARGAGPSWAGATTDEVLGEPVTGESASAGNAASRDVAAINTPRAGLYRDLMVNTDDASRLTDPIVPALSSELYSEGAVASPTPALGTV